MTRDSTIAAAIVEEKLNGVSFVPPILSSHRPATTLTVRLCPEIAPTVQTTDAVLCPVMPGYAGNSVESTVYDARRR